MYPSEVQTNLILEFDRWTGCYRHVQGDVLESIDLQFHPPTSLTRKIASGLPGSFRASFATCSGNTVP